MDLFLCSAKVHAGFTDANLKNTEQSTWLDVSINADFIWTIAAWYNKRNLLFHLSSLGIFFFFFCKIGDILRALNKISKNDSSETMKVTDLLVASQNSLQCSSHIRMPEKSLHWELRNTASLARIRGRVQHHIEQLQSLTSKSLVWSFWSFLQLQKCFWGLDKATRSSQLPLPTGRSFML